MVRKEGEVTVGSSHQGLLDLDGLGRMDVMKMASGGKKAFQAALHRAAGGEWLQWLGDLSQVMKSRLNSGAFSFTQEPMVKCWVRVITCECDNASVKYTCQSRIL